MQRLKLRKPTEEHKHLKAWSKRKLLYSNVKTGTHFLMTLEFYKIFWMDVFAFTKQIHFLNI